MGSDDVIEVKMVSGGVAEVRMGSGGTTEVRTSLGGAAETRMGSRPFWSRLWRFGMSKGPN